VAVLGVLRLLYSRGGALGRHVEHDSARVARDAHVRPEVAREDIAPVPKKAESREEGDEENARQDGLVTEETPDDRVPWSHCSTGLPA